MKRGSRAPQHSKQQVRQPGRRKKQPDTQREGPIQQKLDWARTPPGNNRGGRGGDSHTHHKQHNREPQCKGGRNREATEETRANKGTQPSKRRQPPKKHREEPTKTTEQGTTQRTRMDSHNEAPVRGWSWKGACNTHPQSHLANEGRDQWYPGNTQPGAQY